MLFSNQVYPAVMDFLAFDYVATSNLSVMNSLTSIQLPHDEEVLESVKPINFQKDSSIFSHIFRQVLILICRTDMTDIRSYISTAIEILTYPYSCANRAQVIDRTRSASLSYILCQFSSCLDLISDVRDKREGYYLPLVPP
jgi:hypothetical protein